MLHVLVAQGFAEQPVFVAGSVIGEHAPDGEAEAGQVGARHQEEPDGRQVVLIGQDGGEGDSGVVVDGDVQILVSGSANVISGISGDGVTGPADVGQALDVEVHQIA